jgi:hypothetical protein
MYLQDFTGIGGHNLRRRCQCREEPLATPQGPLSSPKDETGPPRAEPYTIKVVRTVLNGRDEETGFMHRALSRPTCKLLP